MLCLGQIGGKVSFGILAAGIRPLNFLAVGGVKGLAIVIVPCLLGVSSSEVHVNIW